MASRSLIRGLMAGAALVSLSTAATANGWDGLIVFGDRPLDSGQHVSAEAIFADEGEEIGDGRTRATNNVRGGGRGRVYSQRLSHELGFGALNPSQPVVFGDIPTPPSGLNYAGAFNHSRDVLKSITGTARVGGVRYLGSDGEQTVVEGQSRPGLLNDPERRDSVWNALVIVAGGMRDLRETADVYGDLNGEVDLSDTGVIIDGATRDAVAGAAADNIADGVAALTDAGAGLVVVANSMDLGRIPEVGGDSELIEEADSLLVDREVEAREAAERALDAADDAALALSEVDEAAGRLDTANSVLAALQGNPDATPENIEASIERRDAAADAVLRAEQNASERLDEALAASIAAETVQLTEREREQRVEIDALLADPDLIQNTRTAATDAYNGRLRDRLRDIDGNVVLVDQRALFDAVIADPDRFGLDPSVDTATDCLDDSLLYGCNEVSGDIEERLFQNGIDLTETGHQIAAEQIYALVTAPAALSTLPALGISSGRGVADASRDQVSREQAWRPGVSVFGTGIATRAQVDEDDGFVKQDGLGYGGVAGIKYAFANGIAIGAAGSYQVLDSSSNESALKYDGNAYFGSVFAGVNSGPVFGSVTATYGKVDFGDVGRVSNIGAARIVNRGDTEGTVSGVTAEAGLRLVQYDIVRAGPIVNFSHWRSDVDGYDEDGWRATAVSTGDIDRQSTRAGIGMFLEAGNMVDGQGALFRAKALYGHEFEDDTQRASVTPLGENAVGSFETQVRGVDDAPLELGAEVVLGFQGVTTTFGYDGLFGDLDDHRFRIGASIPLGF